MQSAAGTPPGPASLPTPVPPCFSACDGESSQPTAVVLVLCLPWPSMSRLFQLKMILIKCCDISNEVRPMEVAEPWVDCLLEEYFMQVRDAEPSNHEHSFQLRGRGCIGKSRPG